MDASIGLLKEGDATALAAIFLDSTKPPTTAVDDFAVGTSCMITFDWLEQISPAELYIRVEQT